MKYGVIYKITNIVNGKIYIGQTVRSIEVRWKNHCSSTGCRKLSRSINKYGILSFTIEEIEICSTKEDLDSSEKFWIKHFDSVNSGYNLSYGGHRGLMSDESKKLLSESLTGHTVSKITRDKIGLSNKGKCAGSKNPFFGKKHSEEILEKLSKYSTGVSPSSDTRNKIGIKSKESWAKRAKPIEGINLTTGEIIRFDRMIHVKNMGFNTGHVSECIHGNRKHHKGYKWRFEQCD